MWQAQGNPDGRVARDDQSVLALVLVQYQIAVLGHAQSWQAHHLRGGGNLFANYHQERGLA